MTATIVARGIDRAFSRLRILRVASRPSMTGIEISTRLDQARAEMVREVDGLTHKDKFE